jgi:hypothetical protein
MRFVGRTVAALLAVSVFSGAASAGTPAADAAANSTVAKRGGYLVRVMGCNDCHTPWKMGAQGPEPDLSRMLSGHPEALAMPPAPALGNGPWAWAGAGTMTAFSGPWGVSFAANLTPDKETGLGSWTEEMFTQALRTGRHQGRGRPIMPPMPWPNLAAATDEDLHAMWAFMRTIPAIHNQVPQPVDPAEAAPAAQGTH